MKAFGQFPHAPPVYQRHTTLPLSGMEARGRLVPAINAIARVGTHRALRGAWVGGVIGLVIPRAGFQFSGCLGRRALIRLPRGIGQNCHRPVSKVMRWVDLDGANGCWKRPALRPGIYLFSRDKSYPSHIDRYLSRLGPSCRVSPIKQTARTEPHLGRDII